MGRSGKCAGAHRKAELARVESIATVSRPSITPKMIRTFFSLVAALFVVLPVSAQNDFPPQPVPKFLSPAESQKLFQLPEGYSLELVLSEPHIKEPAVVVFDGDGNMYVAEMRTYMQDIDGSGKFNKVSRVSKHTDTNGDGKYDKHIVFIDKLMLPRILLPLDDRLIVGETNTNDLFAYRDTDGDGVADEKKPFYIGGNRGGNLEHQPSGLIWSMDNWLYTTYNAYRLRLDPVTGTVRKEGTGSNGGQWGLTQDNHGKPWYVNAGGERGPLNFQVPIVYGALNTGDQFAPNYRTVYPLVPIPDVQGGNRRFRPKEKTLNHFTATCGQEIFRGDRLPGELLGNLFFGEPVGRLVRRTVIKNDEGVSLLSNPHPQSEFIRTPDAYFRPINAVTAPDGTLYIVDMYRGIIQEGNWVRRGSYLRKVVQQYQLDKAIGRGRIWRLVHKDHKPGPQPKMLKETSEQLVTHLGHRNGWWRDTAQKLLILRGDKSVAGSLKQMAFGHKSYLARMHALWTLEGLGLADAVVIRAALKDEYSQVRITGIRVSESLHKDGDDSLTPDLNKMTSDKRGEVVLQALMTAKHLRVEDWQDWFASARDENDSRAVQELAPQLVRGSPAQPRQTFTKTELKVLKKGEGIYRSLCFACHGKNGKGMPIPGDPKGATMAASFLKNRTILGHPSMSINVVLHGLTGPVDGKTYPNQMISMKSYDDEWVSSVLSYVRNSFGNRASFITKEQVAATRKATAARKEPWTIEALRATVPQYLSDRKKWKLTASHNTGKVGSAVDGNLGTRFDTGAVMVPGMWFQIELPKAMEVSGLRLDSAGSVLDYPDGYEVSVSLDGKSWAPPLIKGKGVQPLTEIYFRGVKAKFIKITQTGKRPGKYWSIHDLQISGK